MLKERTYDALIDFGIDPSKKGFNYIVDAVELFDPDKKACEMYEEIAKLHATSAANVERAMRYAFSSMDYKSEMVKEFFGKKFTNIGYISILRWKLSRR
jgi:type I site-specific restriction-modification system R (restriction) subunit